MTETGMDLIRLLQEMERTRILGSPSVPMPTKPADHSAGQAEVLPDSPVAPEWNCYCREVARLVAEGHKGRWVAIKSEQVLGVWDTLEEARQAIHLKCLTQPVLIKQIQPQEVIVRCTRLLYPGFVNPCRS